MGMTRTRLLKPKLRCNMTSRDFCFWLQGVFEISKPDAFDMNQLAIIKKHLDLVFVHEIDPAMGDKAHQDKLNEVHNTKDLPSGVVMRC